MDQKPPEAAAPAATAPNENGGRVVAIVLVALLAVCFVGSCSVGAVSLVSSISDNTKSSGDDGFKPKPFATKKKTVAPDPDPDEPPTDDTNPGDPLATPDPTPDEPPEAEPQIGPWVAPVDAQSQFAIFHLTKPKTDGWAAIQRVAKAAKLKVYRDEIPEEAEGDYLVYRSLPTESEYGAMSGEALDVAHGLTDKEKDAVLEAKTASVIDVTLETKDAHKLLDVAKVLLEFQKATGGVLWDEEAQEYFSGAEWKKLRIDSWEKTSPDALRHFTVFVTTKGDSCDLLTGGLAHFGVPELKVTRVPVSDKGATISLVNVLAQQMLEGSIAATPGRATLELNKVKHKARRETWKKDFAGGKGEADVELVSVGTIIAPVLEVRFPGGGSVATRLGATLDSLLGKADAADGEDDDGGDGDGATGGLAEDPAVKKVSQVQMKLFASTVKPKFLKGLKAGDTLSVLAPFPADSGGNEWVWVKVSKIKNDGTIIGSLGATPKDVGGLVQGDEVVVVESELLDWMLKSGGVTTGNATAPVLKRLGK
ncbi:MAG: DUF2314 domain-containing protein [Archangium sp.]